MATLSHELKGNESVCSLPRPSKAQAVAYGITHDSPVPGKNPGVASACSGVGFSAALHIQTQSVLDTHFGPCVTPVIAVDEVQPLATHGMITRRAGAIEGPCNTARPLGYDRSLITS